MPRKTSYPQRLEREFGSLIDDLELGPHQKRALRSPLARPGALARAEGERARNVYYGLRLTTLIGALLVPALVTITLADDTLDTAVKVATWVVSLVVALTAAIEQFFHFGDRWRNYRRTVERLKAEGWLYLQLSGRYAANGVVPRARVPGFRQPASRA